MNFHDKETTKKGDIGEQLVRDCLVGSGIIPYMPLAPFAHPFDILCATRDKQKIFVVEVKTKEARKYYPDTGINVSHYKTYKFVIGKYKIPVWIFFVDATNKAIYGNTLTELEKPELVNGKQYPLIQKQIIFFPLSHTKKIVELSDEQCESIKAHNTKNYSGAWQYPTEATNGK